MARWRQKNLFQSVETICLIDIGNKRCLEPGWKGCVSGNQSCGTYINFLRKAEVSVVPSPSPSPVQRLWFHLGPGNLPTASPPSAKSP